MAEFTEVMRQAHRMCVAVNDCENCPAATMVAGCAFKLSPQFLPEKDRAEMERVVMQWAAEHPEQRYPTWLDWLKSVFHEGKHDTIVPCSFATPKHLRCDEHYDCDHCRNSPIPADIAEKLGIKPIGEKA